VDKTKKLIDKLNPTQPNMSDTLFKDLGEFEFRTVHASVFYSTPTIPNSGSFAEFYTAE
jgi:hypothetical protein